MSPSEWRKRRAEYKAVYPQMVRDLIADLMDENGAWWAAWMASDDSLKMDAGREILRLARLGMALEAAN